MKRIVYGLLFLCLLAFAVGCGSEGEQAKEEAGYQLYYLNNEKTKVISTTCSLKPSPQSTTGHMVRELSRHLFEELPKEQGIMLLPEGVTLLRARVSEDVLWLDFNAAYAKMNKTEEVLVRASLVRTFTQIPGITGVGFLVEGKRLQDSAGNDIEILNSDSFVENSGKEINTYQSVTMKLYFANEDGSALREENRSVYYSTSMPLERVIVEQLLKGPQEEGNGAVLPPDTKILGVTVADNVCYVNFDKTFAEASLNVQPEVTIYAIVNSLVSARGVSQVQISVNGDSKAAYKDSVKLDTFFSEDLSLLEEQHD